MSLLKITAIGNLGRDPELKWTTDGKAVCNFSMACSERRKDKSGEMQETTTWIRVTFWGNQAENASKYLSKGKPVYIEGRGRLETYTDRDGKGRTTLEVFGTEMQFIAPRDDANRQQSAPANSPRARAEASVASGTSKPLDLDGDDDIPF